MSVTPDSRLGDPKDHLIADLQRQLAECRAELTQRTTERDEALQREIATAEVLQVINASPGDLAPVFDVILEKAHTLCGATLGSLVLREGEQLRSVATRGYPQLYAELVSQGFPVTWSPSFERLIDAPFIQIPDARALPATNPITRTGVEIAGIRTILRVPLRKDRELLGSITAQRQEVRPFSESEIALLQNFAAQAVIAMENARLINETREALEQQTATAEILRVINSSPGALAPVFETILEKAHTLCGATKGALAINSSGNIRIVATRGLSEEFATLLRRRQSIAPDGPNARLLGGEDLIHILDIRALQGPTSQAVARLEGVRTILFVALRKDRELLGYITAYRTEIRPFSDKHIALLQSFAAQAVIAMENARLIDETREALEQQTATAEVLGIINSSPGDLTPVFDAILEKAHSLCGIALGSLELYDGERFRAVAIRGLPEAFADMLRRGYPASDNPATRPLIEGGRFTHIRDLAETEYAITQSSAELDAARTSCVCRCIETMCYLG